MLNITTPRLNSRSRRIAALAVIVALPLAPATSAVFFQEGFNTDGEAANPQRYTTLGRNVYEVDRITSELGLTDQLGPIYWAHNFEVSYAGVPAPTPSRRAIFSWNNTMPADTVTPDLLELFESTIAWLAYDKAPATICWSPGVNGTGDEVLANYLSAQGYTIIQDNDGAQPLPEADAYVHSSSGDLGNPSRLTSIAKGVLTYRAADHDDMLVSSIGTTVTSPTKGAEILAATHPAAGGKTGAFEVLTDGDGTFDLPGSDLPGGAIILAEFTRAIPPTAASLADVDAMADGSKPSTQFTGKARDMDFDFNSAGDWDYASPIPGSPADAFGVVIRGTLTVSTAGTYSLALGVDDGARLRIDTDGNGITDADSIITEDAAGAHRAVYADATFGAAGNYAFEITWFNSGGGASLEFSAAIAPGGGQRNPIVATEGIWEVLGAPDSLLGAISLPVDADVTTYVPGGPQAEETVPLMVLLEGPEDGGSVFGGGPFSGFEGTGFFAASGANKWVYPNGLSYRSLTLAPINVVGRQEVTLTLAVAATFLDFETSDFLDILAYPNGPGSTPVRLARFSAPDANSKYFVDVDHGGINRLSLNFRDVSYPVPATATDLVLEFRAATTWWNEIVAFDNVRLSEGSLAPPALSLSSAPNGDLTLNFEGTLESAPAIDATFETVAGNPQGSYTIPRATQTEPRRFYRARN